MFAPDSGIFVDCDGTLYLGVDNPLNAGLLTALSAAKKAGHRVTLLTGGGAENFGGLLQAHIDEFPSNLLRKVKDELSGTTFRALPDILNKKAMAGWTLQVVIDDTPQSELTSQYGFTAKTFIDARGKTDADYFIASLQEALGPFKPRKDASSKAKIPFELKA